MQNSTGLFGWRTVNDFLQQANSIPSKEKTQELIFDRPVQSWTIWQQYRLDFGGVTAWLRHPGHSTNMDKRDIIVIGASAGGFEALKKMVAQLPAGLAASIFIVWHMAPDVKGVLPDVLNKLMTLPATHPFDREPIIPGKIYIAPPDHHLLIEKDRVRITKGPKENGFRPAVDPLFRSAAYAYGPRVIGVVLSGGLDDGTAGLWVVKKYNGLAIVQDPEDAEVAAMPQNALDNVAVDYILPAMEIPALLADLVTQVAPEPKQVIQPEEERVANEIRIALDDHQLEEKSPGFGQLTPFTCPECHGVLSAIKEGKQERFRCHTGHAFSADSLLVLLSSSIEDNLWSAVRIVKESVMLLNHLGDHFAALNQPRIAALYFKKAKDAEKRAAIVHRALTENEQLNAGEIEHGE